MKYSIVFYIKFQLIGKEEWADRIRNMVVNALKSANLDETTTLECLVRSIWLKTSKLCVLTAFLLRDCA